MFLESFLYKRGVDFYKNPGIRQTGFSFIDMVCTPVNHIGRIHGKILSKKKRTLEIPFLEFWKIANFLEGK